MNYACEENITNNSDNSKEYSTNNKKITKLNKMNNKDNLEKYQIKKM